MTSVFSVRNNLDLKVQTSSDRKPWYPDDGISIPLGLTKMTSAASRFQTAQADSSMEL